MDKFESAVGIITLEQVLEQIVGEVVDVNLTFNRHLLPHKTSVERLDEATFLLDGRLPIVDTNMALGIAIPTTEAHTINGAVISH